jgi:hypothetical protein
MKTFYSVDCHRIYRTGDPLRDYRKGRFLQLDRFRIGANPTSRRQLFEKVTLVAWLTI